MIAQPGAFIFHRKDEKVTLQDRLDQTAPVLDWSKDRFAQLGIELLQQRRAQQKVADVSRLLIKDLLSEIFVEPHPRDTCGPYAVDHSLPHCLGRKRPLQ